MATRSIEAKLRKRRFAPKARTGCQTCKIRRVKCDEQQPSCHRCVSTGRICDGYDSIRLAQPKSQKDGTLTLRWVQSSPSPLPPGGNGREQSAFYNFRLDLLETLAGPFEDVVWHRQVLPLSMAEPAVWHAVVALGSLGQAGVDKRNQEPQQFAIQQYGKAMKALQNRMTSARKLPQNLTLLICLLFVTFEFQQRGYGEAHTHLNGGLKIIQEYEQRPEHSPELTSDVMDPLIEAFERLDVQMSSFTSSQVHLKRSHATVSGERPIQFERISDAMRELNFLLGSMRDLDWKADARKSSHEGMSSEDVMVFQEHMIRLLQHLHRWHLAMNDLQSRTKSIKDQISIDILRVRQIYCKLKVSNCLTDGRECLWDSYLTDFEQLIKTAECVVFRRAVLSAEKGKINFTLDTGIIPPVYFTVLKCRDPNLRRRALVLLKNCKHQEGAWNGAIIAFMAENVMRLEERGLDNALIAADVPEVNRMYQAFYDLRRSDKLVYCKRRRYETDGAWLQFTVPFD